MRYEKLTQYGPFPIRIIGGIAFILHGLPKLSNLSGTEDFFANMVGLPAMLALPVGLLELEKKVLILSLTKGSNWKLKAVLYRKKG